MVRGAGSEPPTGIDHPKDINDHTPTVSRVEHCGCAARAQQKQRTSRATLVRFRVYILFTAPIVSGGRREAPPAAGRLLMEPVCQPAASPPFVTRNARTDEKRGQQNGELWSNRDVSEQIRQRLRGHSTAPNPPRLVGKRQHSFRRVRVAQSDQRGPLLPGRLEGRSDGRQRQQQGERSIQQR